MRFARCWLLFALALPAAGADKPGATSGPATGSESLVVESALVTVIEQVEVPTRVEGVLVGLTAREGQLVAAGETLARIEDTESVLTLRRAAIEADIAGRQARTDLKIRTARKGAELADVEWKRGRESFEKYKKSVSEMELDRLRLSAEKAALDVDQATHDQQIAELTLSLKETERQLAEAAVERRRIIAPLAGVVVQVHKHLGEWVEPGQTVLRLLRVDRLRVEGLVTLKKLSGDPTGRPTTLTVDLPGQPAAEFPGVIVFVSPEVNPVNGQVRIWAEVENRELRLRPGLQGTLSISAKDAGAAKRDSK